jgi:hypothetical protein
MESKENKDGFNINLLQILDRLKNKMDKDLDSIKTKSYRSHYKII